MSEALDLGAKTPIITTIKLARCFHSSPATTNELLLFPGPDSYALLFLFCNNIK